MGIMLCQYHIWSTFSTLSNAFWISEDQHSSPGSLSFHFLPLPSSTTDVPSPPYSSTPDQCANIMSSVPPRKDSLPHSLDAAHPISSLDVCKKGSVILCQEGQDTMVPFPERGRINCSFQQIHWKYLSSLWSIAATSHIPLLDAWW